MPRPGSDPDWTFKGVALKGVGRVPVEGEVLLWDRPISFLGDVNPETGDLSREGFEANISGRIVLFTEGAGSTVGSYVIYNLKLNGKAPRAMVMAKADAIITIGCILADIPLVHRVPMDQWGRIKTGDWAVLDPVSGTVCIWKSDRE
ncbi:MAG: aconitase X swivel domain-containing protein [Thermoplasmatota archaeon]